MFYLLVEKRRESFPAWVVTGKTARRLFDFLTVIYSRFFIIPLTGPKDSQDNIFPEVPLWNFQRISLRECHVPAGEIKFGLCLHSSPAVAAKGFGGKGRRR